MEKMVAPGAEARFDHDLGRAVDLRERGEEMARSRARRWSELAGEALAAEAHAFRRKLPQLMRRYAGEFVAL